MITLGKPLSHANTTTNNGHRVRLIPPAVSNPVTQRILTIRQQRQSTSITRRPGLVARLTITA